MSLSEDPASSFARELSPDERLLWAGRPRRGVLFFRTADLFAIPLALVWCGIISSVGFSMLSSALRGGSIAWPSPIAVALMMLFGLYMLVGRFLVDSRQREKTVYAVTSKRIIICSGLLKRTTD